MAQHLTLLRRPGQGSVPRCLPTGLAYGGGDLSRWSTHYSKRGIVYSYYRGIVYFSPPVRFSAL